MIAWGIIVLKRFLLDMFEPSEHDKPYFGRSFNSYQDYVRYVRNEQHWFLTWWRGERDLLKEQRSRVDPAHKLEQILFDEIKRNTELKHLKNLKPYGYDKETGIFYD